MMMPSPGANGEPPKAAAPEAHIIVAARVDAAVAPQLDAELRALQTGETRTIVVDMARTRYMSSSGLRVLLLAHRRQVERGGRLVLRNIAPRILQIMRIAGFDRVFEIERDAQAPPTRADGQQSRQ